jgi:hypothetical protein
MNKNKSLIKKEYLGIKLIKINDTYYYKKYKDL